jgi:hypothetical protein
MAYQDELKEARMRQRMRQIYQEKIYEGNQYGYGYNYGGEGTPAGAKKNAYIQYLKKHGTRKGYKPKGKKPKSFWDRCARAEAKKMGYGAGAKKARKTRKKANPCKNPWLVFLAKYRKMNPGLSYKEAMKEASVAYNAVKGGAY